MCPKCKRRPRVRISVPRGCSIFHVRCREQGLWRTQSDFVVKCLSCVNIRQAPFLKRLLRKQYNYKT